jgi:hypothetical protein
MLRAPANHGEVLALPQFEAIPALVAENRRRLDRSDVKIGGLPLSELRHHAYDQTIVAARDYMNSLGEWVPGCVAYRWRDFPPLIVAGHQPEFAHPGVWVKNFALNGIARKLDGIPLHLIVDTDTLKNTTLRFPVLGDGGPTARLESLAFDRPDGEATYECRTVLDEELFSTFPTRAAALTRDWPFEPLLPKVWHVGRSIGETFTAIRRECEGAWGCHNLELPVSRLAQIESFAHFARHILSDLPRFREVYNAAIRAYRATNHVRSHNHPAPELAEGEAPFWVRTSACRRERAIATSDASNLRPRALTLTLFARLCLGDFFIHGIGGGKYDEVTDEIVRAFFGIEPPSYQVLSATLHLPLPTFPSTPAVVRSLERTVRDLRWNPHRFVPPGRAHDLVERHFALAASKPPYRDHAARRAWYRELQQVKEEMRPLVAGRVPEVERELGQARAEMEANTVLRRRDYSWVLYPEETLRPFLQRFLR